MPTKEELQDRLDEMSLELDRAREEAQGEIATLRDELGRSEELCSQLRATTSTLTEGQSALERIYRERIELLLARVGAEARLMEEAGGRWAAEREQLTADLAGRDSTIGLLEARVEGFQRQLMTQYEQLTRADRTASSEIATRDRKVEDLTGRLSLLTAQLREVEEGRQHWVIGILEMLALRPGCWLAVGALAGIVWMAVYVVNSILEWMKPSPGLLGS